MSGPARNEVTFLGPPVDRKAGYREHAENRWRDQPAEQQYREPDAVARAGCSAEDRLRPERTVFFGVMPGGTTAGRIYGDPGGEGSGCSGADVHIVFQDQGTVYLGVVCMKEDAGAVEEAPGAKGSQDRPRSGMRRRRLRKWIWKRKPHSAETGRGHGREDPDAGEAAGGT